MRIRGLFLSGYLFEVVQPATGNPSNALTTRQRGLLALSDPNLSKGASGSTSATLRAFSWQNSASPLRFRLFFSALFTSLVYNLYGMSSRFSDGIDLSCGEVVDLWSPEIQITAYELERQGIPHA